MSRFNIFVINLEDGTIEGTNDVDEAAPYTRSLIHVVILANSGGHSIAYLNDGGKPIESLPIRETDESEEDDEESDDD